MNIKCILFLIFMLNVLSIQAQDKIVTTSGDTIECRIVSVSDDYIIYEQFVSDKGIVGNRLPVEQMSTYTKGENSKDMYRQKKSIPPAQRWQIGIQGGTGLTLASAKGIRTDFHKKMKWGNHYGADIHYWLNRWGSLGVKYSGFYTSAGTYLIIDVHDGRTYYCANVEKRIYINFAGLSFSTQQYFAYYDKLRLTFASAYGLAHYRDEEEYDNYKFSNYLLKSTSFGFSLELSAEYFPLSWMSVGTHVSCFGAWFWKGKLSDGYNNTTVKFKELQINSINAMRLDLSIGIKFYL